jgi:Flp pilus assembly pilin Flp
MKTRAQSTIEYAVLITIIVLAVVAMNNYVRRAVNANLKNTEEQLNQQVNPTYWNFPSNTDSGGGDDDSGREEPPQMEQ